MDQPHVSVCIPLYNKAEFVAETIESVLAQTYTDLEVVVLDNASTDGSGQIAETYRYDPRVRLERNPTTIPAPDNFRRAVELSRGSLAKIVCADDVILPACVERQVAVFDADPSVVLVAGRQDLMDGRGATVLPARGLRSLRLLGRHEGREVLREVTRRGGNPIGANGSVMFRRATYDALPVSGAGVFMIDDIALCGSLLAMGAFHGQEETVAGFRSPERARRARLPLAWLAAQWRLAVFLRGLAPSAVSRTDVLAGCVRTTLVFVRHNALVSTRRGPVSPWSRRPPSREAGGPQLRR